MIKIFEYLGKFGACYYLFRSDDMIVGAAGVILAFGFICEVVDKYKNGNIICLLYTSDAADEVTV